MKIFSDLVAFESRIIMWEIYPHTFFSASVFCHDYFVMNADRHLETLCKTQTSEHFPHFTMTDQETQINHSIEVTV